MSSRRRGREKRHKLDPVEAAFAEAAAAVARRDLDGALAWAKLTRAIEDAERKCGIHRRAEEWLQVQHARNMARVAEAEKELERRRDSIDATQDRVNRLAAELRLMKARLQKQLASAS